MTRWLPLATAATLTTLPPRHLLARALSGSLPAHYLDHTVWIDYPALLALLARSPARTRRPRKAALRSSVAPTPATLDRLLRAMSNYLTISI